MSQQRQVRKVSLIRVLAPDTASALLLRCAEVLRQNGIDTTSINDDGIAFRDDRFAFSIFELAATGLVIGYHSSCKSTSACNGSTRMLYREKAFLHAPGRRHFRLTYKASRRGFYSVKTSLQLDRDTLTITVTRELACRALSLS